MQPQITGPAAWPAAGPPPEFTVDAAGRALFMVEVAASRLLLTSLADRSPDNYFFGGETDGVFACGTRWTVPPDAWARLAHARVLFYRVVAVDQNTGDAAMSVDDQHLDALPALVVEAGLEPARTPPREQP